MVEYCIPQKNESVFISRAYELGISELVFLYPLSDFKSIVLPDAMVDKKVETSVILTSKNDTKNSNAKISTVPIIEKGILLTGLVTPKEVQKALQFTKHVVVWSNSIRAILEQTRGVIFAGMEFSEQSDFIHFRNSGLNHILVGLARRRDHRFIFPFSRLQNNGFSGVVLARVSQNIALCRKGKVSYTFNSFAYHPYELKPSFHAIRSLTVCNSAPSFD